MSKQGSKQPYKLLGIRLKLIRQKLQESVAEVSGAVEIDTDMLENFEFGAERPSEDLLMLLISHFGMRDDEAVSLWELAGYDSAHRNNTPLSDESSNKQLPITMMLALDTRILYSDGINVSANPNGIVVSFTQNVTNNQTVPIARVGMSREQAQNVMQVLHQAMNQLDHIHTPKALPAPKNTKKPKSDTN